jgi:hypothetical protein
MKWRTLLLPVIAVLMFAPQAQSQTLIAQYFRCSTADEGEADFIMNEVFADVYQSQVDSGDLIGWGWVEHLTGGQWRRIATMTAADLTTAWDSWGSIVEAILDEHPNAWHRFNEICPSHDDYIWNLIGSSENEDAGFTPDMWASSYWVCDSNQESRADELLQQMVPVFDKHIAAGHISGWGWYGHVVGGRFRRLLTLSSADDFNLLEGREMVVAELQAEQGDALEEFGDICGGHVDYIWANAADTDDEDDD